MVSTYPVTFDVDFPARPLDRLTSALRIFAAIPILIVIASVYQQGDPHDRAAILVTA
jgi:hypothetical protein